MSVRYAMLALPGEGPKYGPRLRFREEFEARTDEVWPLNVGQVYSMLQRLERVGLVEPVGGGDVGSQEGYRITAEGEQELAGWLRTLPHLSSPPRNELVMKVLVALRVPSADAHAVIRLDSVVRWLDAPEARVKHAAADGPMTWATRRAHRTRRERRGHGGADRK